MDTGVRWGAMVLQWSRWCVIANSTALLLGLVRELLHAQTLRSLLKHFALGAHVRPLRPRSDKSPRKKNCTTQGKNKFGALGAENTCLGFAGALKRPHNAECPVSRFARLGTEKRGFPSAGLKMEWNSPHKCNSRGGLLSGAYRRSWALGDLTRPKIA